MGSRPTSHERHGSPGPGAYETYNSAGISHSMQGKNQRESKSDGPGPGTYSTESGTQGLSCSMTPRREADRVCGCPGPGAYDLLHLQDDTSPKYSMRGKNERLSKRE